MDDQHPDIYPDDPYGGPDDPYGGDVSKKDNVSDDDSPIEKMLARFNQPGKGGGKKLPPPSGGDGGGDGEDDEEDGMLRMSFLDHLGELRSRIIRALVGFGVAFLVCLVFSNQLWLIVQAPAIEAFHRLAQKGQQEDD